MRINPIEKELLVLIVFCNCLVKASPCDGIPGTIEFDGKCYEFKNTKKSYASAQEYCNEKGGILLEITNDGIKNFVCETISNLGWSLSYIYIGFTKTTGKNPWLRQNGDEITYEDWLIGQKICFKSMEHLCTSNCVILDFFLRGWSDTDCEEEFHHAYEYDIPKQQDNISNKPTTIEPGKAITVSDATKGRSCDCEECIDTVRQLQSKEEIARKIKLNLMLDRKTLSKYKNTKVSLGDKRLSAKVLGLTGGGVIVTSILIIVVPDLYKLLCYIKAKCRRKLIRRRKSKHVAKAISRAVDGDK